MFKFIVKGIFRDRHRWLFPVVIVSAGVLIMVFTLSFMEGYKNSFIRQNARFDTGHLKVVSRAYAEMLSQKPYDLALLDIDDDLSVWQQAYPQLDWVQRINFGALLDVPDAKGETRAQGEVAGFAVDLLSSDKELELLHLKQALVSGNIPKASGEVLVSSTACNKLEIKLGDTVTLIGGSVYGAMTMQNFRVVGTVSFGVGALDNGAVVADISDIRKLLDMEGGAGEILAFFKSGDFNAKEASRIAADFNKRYTDINDEFSPQMLSLMEQNNLAYLLGVFSSSMGWMAAVFVFILGIVLWNSGLMNGIRRYGEFGVRLAIGEGKKHVYLSLLSEALVIGIIGSCIGLALGLAISLYFNHNGMDVSAYNRNSSILSENVIFTSITPAAIWASFIPGVLSTLFGAALAGIAIYKRQTSQLFKELEA
jgi:putative ABC transport system permease protein